MKTDANSASDQDGSAPWPISAWEEAQPQRVWGPFWPGHGVGRGAPRGNLSHKSCWDKGMGAKRSLPLGCCNNLQAGEGQRHRAASIPCLQAQPWLQNPHKTEPGQELPWGSTGCCRVTPAIVTPGQVEAPGVLAGAAEPGRRCCSSLCSNRAAAAPR